jgi:hypothetical protein
MGRNTRKDQNEIRGLGVRSLSNDEHSALTPHNDNAHRIHLALRWPILGEPLKTDAVDNRGYRNDPATVMPQTDIQKGPAVQHLQERVQIKH